jgi:hypothetical protein
MKPPYIQYSTTGTGATITIDDTQDEVQLIHESALVAVLTIAFPTTPVDGQRVYISSVGGVTALTLTTAVGSIASTITSLVAGGIGCYIYRKASTKWYKIR